MVHLKQICYSSLVWDEEDYNEPQYLVFCYYSRFQISTVFSHVVEMKPGPIFTGENWFLPVSEVALPKLI